MACFGWIDENSELFSIFGEEKVEIENILPIIPREEGNPPCYMVVFSTLNEQQQSAIAKLIFDKWQHECESIGEVEKYIFKYNFPLKTNHFSSIGTDDYGLVNSLMPYDDFGCDDPVVLYDPEYGAITNSQLTEIVDRVKNNGN